MEGGFSDMGSDGLTLMVLDMQNDFCSDDGIFAQNGFDLSEINAIVPNIARVMQACSTKKIPIIATQLTVLTDLEGQPMGVHMPESRQFVLDGFRVGTPGHGLISALPEPDYVVRKWGYSSMYQTELEKLVTALNADTLILTGIATSGVVEGTARDAHARGLGVLTLGDCVAGYDADLHDASLRNLGNLGKVVTSEDFIGSILA